MKSLLLFSLLLFATVSGYAFDHSALDRILATHVNSRGMVDYASLQKNRSTLDSYLGKTGSVSEATFQAWGKADQLAFLINVYNAETLQYIIDHYPLASIKELGGLFSKPWDEKNVTLFGKARSLDYLEHEVIRERFDEPRIHFALVCAAKGCPPLRSEAFTGERLEAQLRDQTRTFLSQSTKNRFEKGILYLSPIFKWYGEDFTKNGTSIQNYVAPYFEGAGDAKKIEYTDYDWSLNTQ